MKKKMLCVAMLAAAILPAVSLAALTEVNFADRVHLEDNHYVVKADTKDEILVFGNGSFVLDGRDLVVTAGKVKILGDYTIRAFPKNSTPPANSGVGKTWSRASKGAGGRCYGCQQHGSPGHTGHVGGKGPQGHAGRDAGDIELRFLDAVEGNGHLKVEAVGENGGRGGVGGRGAIGGRGGPGRDRHDFWQGIHHRHDSPGNGGDGGRGGRGGQGGDGGLGGNGGKVSLLKLKGDIDSNLVVIDVSGGKGGPGGPGGKGGAGGSGGDGGRGNSAGGGGRSGSQGPYGADGPTGATGSPGNLGVISITEYK